MIRHGLAHLSRSSKSIAKFVQPHLIQKLAELHRVSHGLFPKLNAPKQPLYKLKVGNECDCSISYFLFFFKKNILLGISRISSPNSSSSLQEKSMSLYDVLSYPMKTALTGVMCISYAALIYLVG
ncbi:spermatogenesis-associated protein 9-like [Podarcis muralis]